MGSSFNPAIFINIRFAMITPYSESFKDLSNAREWILERNLIFKKVCAPSLISQSRHPDAVLFGFADGLQEEAKEITSALDHALNVETIFQRWDDAAFQEIKDVFNDGMSMYISDDHTHVITIRLDNDDAIHKNYVEEIVDHFKNEFDNNSDGRDFFASYPFGLQADGDNIYAIIYPNGPFQARMERLDGTAICGVYAINHTRIFNRKNASLISKNTPFWVQYVHGGNVSNKVRKGSLCLTKLDDILDNFSLNSDSFKG